MLQKKIEKEVTMAFHELKQQLKAELLKEMKDMVESTCHEIIKVIFCNEKDKEVKYNYFAAIEMHTIGGDFKKRAIAAIVENVSEKCNEAAENLIEGEKFIDSVVKRINSKQVGK